MRPYCDACKLHLRTDTPFNFVSERPSSLSYFNFALTHTGGGASAPGGSLSARASHVIAAAAVHRKEQSDATVVIRTLEKTLSETRAKYGEAQRRMRDVRNTLEMRDRERASLTRRYVCKVEVERRV